ncbi:sulfite exporter TauE/SafE family protein [Microbacterium lacusdiani]
MDWGLALAAFGIGIVVGLTGMGGGALMTPTLVLFFGVNPLTAVSSDLITSAVMKPAGSIVHARHGTVHWRIVLWLMIGSVPSAFLGAVLIGAIGPLVGVTAFVKTALGIALLIAAGLLIVKAYLGLVEWARERKGLAAPKLDVPSSDIPVRVIPTLLVGIVGGLMVGVTSVGSGSFIIIALMALYPLLSMNRLVGTDLVQAVPLVIAAAGGHLLFGHVDWSIVLPLTIGSVPGAILGAQFSSRVPGGLVRRALAIVLLAAGLKLLQVSNEVTLIAVAAALVVGTVGWMMVRKGHGLESSSRRERRILEAQATGDD